MILKNTNKSLLFERKNIVLYLFFLCLCTMTNLFGECTNPKLTRPIVIDIFCTLTTCCQELKTKFNNSCASTLIRQTDVGTTGYTITAPGSYALAENITFAPNAAADAITIDSDNVLLNLQCFILSQDNATNLVNGVRVVSGASKVTIQNGIIEDFTGDGIIIEDDTSIISCNDITIRSCDRGLALNGSASNPIIDVELNGLDLKSNSTGLAYYFTTLGLIQQCNTLFSSNAGFDIRNSFSNHFIDCLLHNTESSSTNSYGIFIDNGAQNIFEYLNIQSISTDSPSSNDSATGFFIGTNENELTLKHSQIHNCVATNNAQAFGIKMEYEFTTINDTGLPKFDDVSTVFSVAWTSDARYLGIGGESNSASALEFTDNRLIRVATFSHGNVVNSVDWSPDGHYLAMGGVAGTGGFQLRVLNFNGTSLTSVANFTHGADVLSVNWSPDGRYVALGGVTGTGTFNVRVLEFTGTSLVTVANFNHGGTVNSVSWSPDQQYLAIGGVSGTGAFTVRVLQFTGTALTTVASFNHGGTINSVDWSPNGRYVGIGGLPGTGGFQVRVLEFTGVALTSVANFTTGDGVVSVMWSPDGQYLAVGIDIGILQALLFNGTSLTSAATYNRGVEIFSIAWIPTGIYFAIGGSTGVGQVDIVSGFVFPQNNTIIDNIISKIQGPDLAVGVQGVSSGRGLSASSGNNLIIKNTVFDCNINYIFVTNIFQQFLVNVYSTDPSLIDNLSFPPL